MNKSTHLDLPPRAKAVGVEGVKSPGRGWRRGAGQGGAWRTGIGFLGDSQLHLTSGSR